MISVVDLFSGIGGFAYGFKCVGGFKTLIANDVDKDMCSAFSKNLPDIPVICDSIASINFSELLRDQSVDVVVGGPPCQAYSTSGKRLLDDPRASLYKQYFRALKEMRPKIFIYENVRGLLSMSRGQLFSELTDLFSSLGYKVRAEVLNAADFGVPQERKRVIVVGTRDGFQFDFPMATHGALTNISSDLFKTELQLYITLGEAIGDLPLIGPDSVGFEYISPPQNKYQALMRANAPKLLKEHDSPRHGEGLLRVIRNVPEGGLKSDIPEAFRPKSGFPNSYGRLWWDKPSTTITRNLGTPSSARCIHPRCHRALTTREGARLQSFPDSYVLSGARAKMNLQIGNAVPPLLAAALARQVRLALEHLG